MIFRNIVLSALLVGTISGLIYGFFQYNFIAPIIFDAETYEVASPAETQPAGHEGRDHSHDAWGPEDGVERAFYTLLSNVLIGIAFGLLLISAMALHNYKSKKPKVDAISGLGWGVAAMLALFVAPAMLGLHPEVPGTIAANLEHRQVWWLYCGVLTAVGIGLIYYAPMKLKTFGLLVLTLPHITGAPHHEELSFANTDPRAVAALTALSEQFYLMTAIGMAIFFLLLGAASGFATRRFVNLNDAEASA